MSKYESCKKFYDTFCQKIKEFFGLLSKKIGIGGRGVASQGVGGYIVMRDGHE